MKERVRSTLAPLFLLSSRCETLCWLALLGRKSERHTLEAGGYGSEGRRSSLWPAVYLHALSALLDPHMEQGYQSLHKQGN